MIHLATLLFAFAGFAAICLSMPRHQADTLGRKLEARRQQQIRAAGWVALAAAYACAVASRGWKFGSVQWVGAIILAALVLVAALLPYRPRWTLRAGVGAAAGGLALCLAAGLSALAGLR